MSTTKQCRKCDEVKDISQFSKHSGTADKLDNRCKDCVKKAKKESKATGKVLEYEVYKFDHDSTEWQVGKPTGTILRIKAPSGAERFEVRVPLGGGKNQSKSFALDKFETEELAREAAEEWLAQTSLSLNLTRNRIRKIDDTTIEVQLTKDQTMITDIEFLDLCQKYTLVATKSGHENADYYAAISIGNEIKSYHNYITGFDMVDHINKIPLDNKLINLRDSDHKINNNNRSINKAGTKTGILGVKYDERSDSYVGRIKQDGVEYSKSFAVKKYGHDEAKEFATEYRNLMNEQFKCANK